MHIGFFSSHCYDWLPVWSYIWARNSIKSITQVSWGIVYLDSPPLAIPAAKARLAMGPPKPNLQLNLFILHWDRMECSVTHCRTRSSLTCPRMFLPGPYVTWQHFNLCISIQNSSIVLKCQISMSSSKLNMTRKGWIATIVWTHANSKPGILGLENWRRS